MRAFCTLVVLAVFILATSVTVAQGPPPHSQGVQKLKNDTNGKAKIRVDKKSGEAKFVQLPADSLPSSMITNKAAKSEERAKAFVREYGNAFGADKPDADLTAVKTERDAMGAEHTVLRQTYEDVPVFGGELKAHFDADGDLYAVNGTFVSNIKLNTTPNLTAEQAAGRAIRTIIKQQARKHQASGRADGNSVFNEADYDDLTAAATTLMVFREGLLRGTPGADHLAYEVEVRNAGVTIREFVFVDAHKGSVIDQITGIYDALDRRAFDAEGFSHPGPNYDASPFWVEGDPLPTTDIEADNMILASGETYDLFFNAFVRDSFNGLGATMDAIFNRGDSCPNASWNGTYISFCAGLTTDDITAHEWGHAYTEFTNNLIYQWQSGALNESYSDIWGETVDLINARGLDAPGVARTTNGCSIYNSSGPDNSYRWLMGEEATGFGGAIRDMWNPNCFGDPASVTDPVYWCNTGDSGGVHINSGIPNHAYALMVDGGIFNGYSGAGIGLTKAAHIEWAAQIMLTPSSNFADNADALEAACSSLIGANLTDLSTGAPTGMMIDASDCAQVTAISEAVEFRTSVVEQCGFEPLLAPDAPQVCEGGAVQELLVENFEVEGAVPAGWTASFHDVANAATFDSPGWMVAGGLPSGAGSSLAAFAPDLIVGDCGADTEAGAVALDSPAIVLPAGEVPHVAFDHWVATEAGWDGGNLKVSINGSPYEVVPSSAYSFNPYNGALNASDNPLGGEEGFTGTDGGSVGGSWGQSQVDLLWVAQPGDTVQFRFDFGTDGCNGLVGWYVDEFNAYSCPDEPFPVCGDGVLGAGQQCDDGNMADGDGCSSSCQIEESWICSDPTPAGSSIVKDWSFEGGVPNADWTASSTFGGIAEFPLCGPGNGCPAAGVATTGAWNVWIGGLSGGVTSSVKQDVTIPPTANELTVQTLRGLCDDPSDTLHVSLDGADIGTIVCDAVDGGFVEQTFSVAGYNDGGTHTLFIGGTVGGTNGTHSNFFVDDVYINDSAITPAQPSMCTQVFEDLSCNSGPVGYDLGIADSWTVVDNEGTGVVWTDLASSGLGTNYTGGDGEAASVSSDAFIFTEYDTELQSNSFSLENATAANLGYLAHYINIGPDLLDLDISTDGGSNWNNLLSWNENHGALFTVGGEAVSIDLAAYLGEPDVQVRWHYYDPAFGDWDWYAQVDNVALTCDQTGQMNGGGIVVGDDGMNYSHGFELQCQDGVVPSNLVINWGSGRDKKMFKLTELTSAACSDRPGLDEGDPDVGFDTFIGAGTGTLNKDPVSIMFRITDAGEPGVNDEMEFTISGPEGASVSSVLLKGNHQAVREE